MTKEPEKNQVQKLCSLLRRDILSPAQEEASKIVVAAQEQSAQMVNEAKEEVTRLYQEAKARIEAEQNAASLALNHSRDQLLEELRQAVSQLFLSRGLDKLLDPTLSSPELAIQFSLAVIEGCKRGGAFPKLELCLPRSALTAELSKGALRAALEEVAQGSVQMIASDRLTGGIQVRWIEKHLVLDLSQDALKNALRGYLQKEFRELLFGPL